MQFLKYIKENIKSCLFLKAKHVAFTLAEVLITLGIIGIVAAITIPALVSQYQKYVIRNQFKKTYSVLENSWNRVIADWGNQPECFYWEQNPYGDAYCSEYNSSGECAKYLMRGSDAPLPGDYNGRFAECEQMREQLKSVMNVSKICLSNSYSNGCIPDYDGIDTVYKAANSDASDKDVTQATSGCGGYRKNSIKNYLQAWDLSDGTIIIWYSGPQIFLVDVNGFAKPNQWGHDLFAFYTTGTPTSPFKIRPGGCEVTPKGGTSTYNMIRTLYDK